MVSSPRATMKITLSSGPTRIFHVASLVPTFFTVSRRISQCNPSFTVLSMLGRRSDKLCIRRGSSMCSARKVIAPFSTKIVGGVIEPSRKA